MLPRSSDFAGAELTWRQALPGNHGGHQLTALIQTGSQNYFSATDYSTLNLSAALVAQRRVGNHQGIHSLSYSKLQLGGHAYLESTGLRTHWQRPLADGRLLGGLGIAYTRLDYNQSAYDAHVYEPGIYILGSLAKAVFRLDWNLIRDNAENERPGGNRQGNAWSLGGLLPTWPRQHVEVHLKATRIDDDAPYLPALFGNATRQSRQTVLSAANIWRLRDNQRLRLEWRFQEQQDTLAIFSYTARNLNLSWEYLLD